MSRHENSELNLEFSSYCESDYIYLRKSASKRGITADILQPPFISRSKDFETLVILAIATSSTDESEIYKYKFRQTICVWFCVIKLHFHCGVLNKSGAKE